MASFGKLRGGNTVFGVQDSPQSRGMTLGMKSQSAVTAGPGRWAILLAFALAATAGAADAQSSLRDAFRGNRSEVRRAPAPPIARYVAETGDAFILDRAAPQPLMKFENSSEVWVLSPQAAPRGDTIYKNDQGEAVLRATRLGGMTVFTERQPDGAAAALVGETSPLKLIRIGPAELIQHIRIAGIRAGRAAQRQINIEFAADSDSASLIADAATAFSEAVIRIAARDDGRKILGSFGKIRIEAAKKPSVKLTDKKVLEIHVTPSMGLAGRPSSERIAYAAGAR